MYAAICTNDGKSIREFDLCVTVYMYMSWKEYNTAIMITQTINDMLKIFVAIINSNTRVTLLLNTFQIYAICVK